MARLTRVRTEVMLATRGKVSGWLDGAHPSVNAGRSLEFHDVREYVRGDDVADIDWKASARRGELLVQRHVAERRTTLLVALATGQSMAAMAGPSTLKRELMLDTAATLASLALAGGDYVGMLHWAAAGAIVARPSTRAVRVERMLTQAERACTPTSPDGDLPVLLERTGTSIRRRGIVAVVTGDIDVDANLELHLRRLAVQHTVVHVVVPDVDPTDERISRPVHDLVEGRELPRALLDDPALAAAWRADVADRATRRSAALSRLAIPTVTLTPGSPVVPQLLSWLRSVRRAA